MCTPGSSPRDLTLIQDMDVTFSYDPKWPGSAADWLKVHEIRYNKPFYRRIVFHMLSCFIVTVCSVGYQRVTEVYKGALQ